MAIGKAFPPREPEVRVDTSKPSDGNEGLGQVVNGKVQQPPEPAFKRLHILYILHDVLSHIYNHLGNADSTARDLVRRAVMEPLRPSILILLQLAACGGGGGGASTSTSDTLLDLVSLWSTTGLFTPEQLDEMRTSVQAADRMEWDAMLSKLATDGGSKSSKTANGTQDDTTWTLPDRHGVFNDPTAPWHELPAANGLFIKRTQGYPLRASTIPQGGFRLRNGTREADPQLQADVKHLYDEVLRCYDKYTNAGDVQDVDALGNIVWKDPDRPTRNYWGFTLDGIERRRELAAKFAEQTGRDSGRQINSAVERAKALAAGRGRGGGGIGGQSDWQAGGGRW